MLGPVEDATQPRRQYCHPNEQPTELITSVRQAAALCNVSRYMVLGWIGFA
jgi:hypothetical protein